ncbi:patatin-like phospholipase family protein [Halomonas sp. M20]|uniref:patatin-like phospholipase family protein n=1 Tax=Halomonas sp. M20 TaxID=2763264 RepID=UPI001D0B293C|nr:patatin-like phospholipase family protein [Halomonas sp. M20]
MWQKLAGLVSGSSVPEVNLALQGGGAHGAYTWGVLDRLLEEGWRIEGVSGTSAGAMNAVALAQGWMDGGAECARQSLADFWQAVANSAPFHMNFLQRIDPNGDAAMPASMHMMQAFTKMLSPYQFNPLDINPLRDILQEQFDFERLQQECPLKLFIAATHVGTGKVKLFRNQEISEKALLASACLPSVHQAVEIEGEYYWDGGYTANPAIYPLIYNCKTQDILLILLNSLEPEALPRSAKGIASRSMDLGFSSSFLREMRTICQARHYIGASSARAWLPRGRLERLLERLRFHLVEADDLADMNGISKLNASDGFINHLHDLGRNRAERWLADKGPSVGRQASVQIERLFT